MNTAQFLATVPLFEGLTPEQLSRFSEVTKERVFPRGSIIVFEQDPGDSLYVVRSGRVKVVLLGEDGREVILGILDVGEYFGELSLIDEQPRSANVMAMEDATLLILTREDFRRRVEEAPTVAWALLTGLSRRLRQADSKIGGLVLLDVPGRVAKLLTDLARETSSDSIPRVLTHQTIAHMIGASRETVSRAMKEFQDAGWIGVVRRKVTITNPEALEKRAQARV